MQPETFLSAVWPELQSPEQHYVICYKRTKEKDDVMRTRVFSSIHGAADFAAKRSEDGFDLYYCISVINGTRRLVANQALMKEFTFDVDCKGDEGHYSNVDEGIAALQALCNLCNVPFPFIVITGGGFHGRWLFEEAFSHDTYRTLAMGFKAIARTNGFKVDFATIGNSVQIMRICGTYNYKRDVPFLIHPLEGTKFQHIKLSDLSALVTLGEEAILTQRSKNIKYVNDPGDIELMASNCAACKQLVKDGCATQPYEMWRGILANASLCKGGDDWAHRYSALDGRYNPDQTQQKLDDARQFIFDGDGGPVTCFRISEFFGPCKECPHFGKIGAPINLGRSSAADLATEEQEQAVTAPEGEIDRGSWLGNDQMTLHTLKPIGHATVEGGKLNLLVLESRGVRMEVEADAVVSLDKMTSVLWNNSKTVIRTSEAKKWSTFGRGIMANALANDLGVMPKTMGWNQDFTILKHGEYQISKDKFEYVPVVDALKPIARKIRPNGETTSNQWYQHRDWVKLGVDKQRAALEPFFYEGYEHQGILILAAGLGGLTWEMVEPEQGGIIFCLYGEKSATGKTTAMQAALSLHAPWDVFLLQNNASMVQHGEKLSVLQNYPAGVDEAYKRDSETLGSYIQMYTQGVPKDRLDRSGVQIIRDVHWSTHSIHTSNRSALAVLGDKPDLLAMGERIIEFRYDTLPCAKVNFKLANTLRESAGFFTPYFIKQLLQDDRIPEFRSNVSKLVEQYNNSGMFRHAHRYKIVALANAVVLAQLVSEYQILQIDIPRFAKRFEEIIRESNETARAPNPLSAASQYISLNSDRIWAKVYQQGTKRGNSPIMRIDMDSSILYISFQPFRKWLQENNWNVTEVLLELVKDNRIDSIVPSHAKMDYTSGTVSTDVEALEYRLTEKELIRLKPVQ